MPNGSNKCVVSGQKIINFCIQLIFDILRKLSALLSIFCSTRYILLIHPAQSWTEGGVNGTATGPKYFEAPRVDIIDSKKTCYYFFYFICSLFSFFL